MFGTARSILAAALAMAALAAPCQASTINEGSDFSGLFSSPTAIGNGFDLVTGTLGAGDKDYLLFTTMASGASTVSITFTPTAPGNANGKVFYSFTPFSVTNTGTSAGNIQINNGHPVAAPISFSLPASFTGQLYLSLSLNLGPVMRYSVSVPGNIALPGVPVPAPALLLGGALVGLGAASRRRARRSIA